MGELGRYLVAGREQAGVGLDALSRTTRIPARLLEALEAGRWEELPDPVFVRGFVTAYCTAVGLDVARGQEALASGLRGRPETRRRPPPPVPVVSDGLPVGASRGGSLNWTYLAILMVFVVGIVVALLTVGTGRNDVSRAGQTLPGYHRTSPLEVN